MKKKKKKEPKTLGELFAALRNRRRLKQDEIGVLLAFHMKRSKPMTQGSVSKIERGVLPISPEVYEAYIQVFKLNRTKHSLTPESTGVEFDTNSTLTLTR